MNGPTVILVRRILGGDFAGISDFRRSLSKTSPRIFGSHRPTVKEDDLTDILSKTGNRQHYVLFALLAGTGLRIDEALAVKATDFGPNCRVLHIR